MALGNHPIPVELQRIFFFSLRVFVKAYVGEMWLGFTVSQTEDQLSRNFSPCSNQVTGAPNDNFRENICSEDDLRSRIFGTFVVKCLACLPLLGFSNI